MMMRRSNRSTIMPAGRPKTSHGQEGQCADDRDRQRIAGQRGGDERNRGAPEPVGEVAERRGRPELAEIAAERSPCAPARPTSRRPPPPTVSLGGVGIDRVGHRGSTPIAPRASALRRSGEAVGLSLGGAPMNCAAATLEADRDEGVQSGCRVQQRALERRRASGVRAAEMAVMAVLLGREAGTRRPEWSRVARSRRSDCGSCPRRRRSAP